MNRSSLRVVDPGSSLTWMDEVVYAFVSYLYHALVERCSC